MPLEMKFNTNLTINTIGGEKNIKQHFYPNVFLNKKQTARDIL